MGLDIYHYKLLNTDKPPSNDAKILMELNYREKSFFALNNNPHFLKLVKQLEAESNKQYIHQRVDYSYSTTLYLKNLFFAFLNQNQLKNPFDENQMNWVFGLDYSFDKINHTLEFDVYPIINQSSSHFANLKTYCFSFSHYIKEINNPSNQKIKKQLDSIKEIMPDYFNLLHDFANNAELINLMKKFVAQIVPIHINNINEDLKSINSNNIIEDNSRHLYEYLESQNELKSSQSLFSCFNLPFIDVIIVNKQGNKSLRFLPYLPELNLIESVVYVDEISYQRKGFCEKSQYHEKYNNSDYHFVFDNTTLKKIAQEFDHNTPIQDWILNEDEFVYFSN